MRITALIAEDEPLLATELQLDLEKLWPELDIVSITGDGRSAFQQALEHQPDIIFLDIQMPGMTGMDCAQALAEDWPDDTKAFPLVVFVTAYDQYAVQAFERAAFDYVLKPVDPSRLAKTCRRLQEALAARHMPNDGLLGADSVLHTAVDKLRELMSLTSASPGPLNNNQPLLQVIHASAGNTITMVPVHEVLYFEAADKYVRVVTTERDHLIRMSLRDLMQQLDTRTFWQVHRSVVVRHDAVIHAKRDESGKLTLSLKGSPDQLVVSRLYADRFKAM